jgi:hypothetical protein
MTTGTNVDAVTRWSGHRGRSASNGTKVNTLVANKSKNLCSNY